MTRRQRQARNQKIASAFATVAISGGLLIGGACVAIIIMPAAWLGL